MVGMHYAGQCVLSRNDRLMRLFTTHHPETRIQQGRHRIIGLCRASRASSDWHLQDTFSLSRNHKGRALRERPIRSGGWAYWPMRGQGTEEGALCRNISINSGNLFSKNWIDWRWIQNCVIYVWSKPSLAPKNRKGSAKRSLIYVTNFILI